MWQFKLRKKNCSNLQKSVSFKKLKFALIFIKMLFEITAETCKIYNLFKNCGLKIEFEVFLGIYFDQVDGWQWFFQGLFCVSFWILFNPIKAAHNSQLTINH